MISYRYRINIGTLSYLVYIFDTAMLTILCLYGVNIGTLSSVTRHTLFTSFTSSTSRCWWYRVYIGTLSYLRNIIYIVDITMLTISCRHQYPVIPHLIRQHRNVDDIMSISCRHRYLVIPRIHRWHHDVYNLIDTYRYWFPVIPRLYLLHRRNCDVNDIVSTSCQYRYPIMVCLSYFFYIVHIVDIMMLTISCRHRYPVIPCLHRWHRDVVDIVSTSCRHQ